MRAHKTTHAALAFFVVAALGVSSGARAQNPSSTKPAVPKTRSGVHHSKSGKKSSARERGQKAPTADRISEIQAALAKDNSFAGNPSGKWDAATVDAMKKFQEAHGLNPTGKLDAKTLQKLGLGSQTAGVAAPTPPVSSSSLTGTPAAPVIPRRQ